MTLVDQQMVEPDLADNEAVGVGAKVEGGGPLLSLKSDKQHIPLKVPHMVVT